MPKFLTVLNKDEVALGYLTNAKNVEIRERLNGEALLSFEIPFDVDDARYLELEGYVKFNGQLYVIKSIEQSDDGRRNLVVRAVHVYVELVDEYIDRTIELFGGSTGTLQNAVDEVLSGTHFTSGIVDGIERHDFYISETNALKALQEIAEMWNVDIWFDNRVVNFGKRGANRGVEIRYGKNLRSLNMPTTTENLITRLYPYGKDGLTIEGVHPTKYIDSPYINDYPRPKSADKRWNDIDDPNELLAKAQEYLETVDKPGISYSVDFAYLSKLGYDVYDEIQVGDTLAITHAPFGLERVDVRVMEYTYYPFEAKLGSVVLSNTKESLTDIIINLAKSKNSVDRAIDKYGNIQFNKLNAAVKTATEALNNSLTELEYPITGGIIARDKVTANNIVVYNSAGIGVSTDNGITMPQVITAGGINASTITTGQLNAAVVDVTNLNASNITSGTMSADKISGGTIDANNVTINNLNASNITSGTIDASIINVLNLSASDITAGTLSANRVSINGTTLDTEILDYIKKQSVISSINNSGEVGKIRADKIEVDELSAVKILDPTNPNNYIVVGQADGWMDVKFMKSGQSIFEISDSGNGVKLKTYGIDILTASAVTGGGVTIHNLNNDITAVFGG